MRQPGEHLNKNIQQVYNNLDTSFDSFPDNNTVDPDAFKKAIDQLKPGDAITIFTPDTTVRLTIPEYCLIRHKRLMQAAIALPNRSVCH